MADSTRAKSPRKPAKSKAIKPAGKKEFPLFGHKGAGRWCKKVKQKLVYFTKIVDDPQGSAALELWLADRDDLMAGRKPRRKQQDGLTVEDLCDLFINAKKPLVASRELSQRTYDDYDAVCKRLIKQFGANRLVDDLRPEDFGGLRASIAKGKRKALGAVRIGNEVNRIRCVFAWGFENDYLERKVKFGSQFDRPSKKVLRVEKSKKPRTMEPAEIRAVIDAASVTMRAQILLGVNCGYGNGDVGKLPLTALDLDGGWVRFARPKTGIDRKAKLWPETIEAIRAALKVRPEPKPEFAGLVFVTRCGESWAKEIADSPTSKEFRKLLNELKLYRPGVSFYTLRHCFQTQGDDAADEGAVRYIMGHAAPSNDMSANYRAKAPSDARLEAVANHVRSWLFAEEGGAK